MPTKPDTDFLAQQRKQLNEISDALAELIDEALPTMVSDIRLRFRATYTKIERAETDASKALARSTQTNNDALADITARLDILEAAAATAAGQLADHIENHTFAHEPDGFPGNHFPH